MVESTNQIKSGATTNVDVSVKILKNFLCVKKKKNHIWYPATYSCKNDKYLVSITENSMITSDEFI